MSRKSGDEIKFVTKRLRDSSGKSYVRVELVVAYKEFRHNFLIHYRKKGRSEWHTSPQIKNSNAIDMHGLDSNSIYEIRVAVLSAAKDVSTFDDIDETDDEMSDDLIEKIKVSNKQKYLSKRPNNMNHIDKFANDFVQQVMRQVFDSIRN